MFTALLIRDVSTFLLFFPPSSHLSYDPFIPAHSIRQDIVKFEELRSQWEYAVDLKFNDKMNNGYLDEKFDADPRPGVVASLTASSLSKGLTLTLTLTL